MHLTTLICIKHVAIHENIASVVERPGTRRGKWRGNRAIIRNRNDFHYFWIDAKAIIFKCNHQLCRDMDDANSTIPLSISLQLVGNSRLKKAPPMGLYLCISNWRFFGV
mmetsp:Transcript_23113/g.48444  ORF Transcript_23113/g.48444 Transcript_23113/m.48444 type:complete len:109 (-) Transcript_23113:1901-2227(-)